VELPDMAALLVPAFGAGEEPKPTDSSAAFFIASASVALLAAASLAAFPTTSTSMALLVTASSVGFSIAAASVAVSSAAFSFTATFLVAASTIAATTSSTVMTDLPTSVVDNVVAFGLGGGAVAAFGPCCPDNGGPLTTDPSLRSSLLLLYRGASSLDNTSTLLGRG
jgi:hypothetical protein